MENTVKVSLEEALKDIPAESHGVATQAIVNFLRHHMKNMDSANIYCPTIIYDLIDIIFEKNE